MSVGLRGGSSIATVVVLSCLAIATGEARAQEGWGATPVLLSTPTSTDATIFAPKVEVDAAGNAVALWTEIGPTDFGPGGVVLASRFNATTAGWSAPVTVSNRRRPAAAIDVAGDADGNAVAVWQTSGIGVPVLITAARFDASTGSWTPVALMSAGSNSSKAAVASSGNGHAAVCWSVSSPATGMFCRRYTPGSGWAAEDTVSLSGSVADVAIDDTGSLLVLGEGTDSVSAQRFDSSTSTWGAVTPLATGLPGPATPGATVAMNAIGDAVATWERGGAIEAARLPSGAATWSSTEVIAMAGFTHQSPRPIVDSTGVITVAWVTTHVPPRVGPMVRQISFTRFANGGWSPWQPLPGQSTAAYGPPGIDVDGAGNVQVAWSQSGTGLGIRLLASRYAAATGQWTTATQLSANDQSAYNADVAVDRRGNAMAVWFQTASGFSVPQALRWTATLPAPVVTGVTPTAGQLDVAFAAPTATDPGLAATNVDYSLDGGATWTPRAPAGAASPVTIGGLTDGVTYQLRLRSVNAAGAGVPTTTARVRSGIGTTPTDLRVVSRSGNIVTLAWREPAAGLVPLEYVIEGGLDGQPAVLATLPTGGAGTQVTVVVPDGAFFVRVAGSSGALRLGTSPSLSIAVNTTAVPSAPQGLLGSASGSTLALSWRNRWEGATPTAIQLSVSGALSASLALPVSESFSVATVPAGTYTFAVTAQNGGAVSPPSAPVTLTFPGTCGGPPLPPSAFSASTQGGSVYLDWLPPATGEAVASYLVSVTGAFTGSFPMAARTLAAPVPAGSYTIRVAAVGLCGTSAQTAAQTVVVP